MLIIGREKLERFLRKHPDATAWVEAWLTEADRGEWKAPHDIRKRYQTASLVGQGRVVFNIRGNRYRLVAAVRYLPPRLIEIRWVGTHAEYDRIDVAEI